MDPSQEPPNQQYQHQAYGTATSTYGSSAPRSAPPPPPRRDSGGRGESWPLPPWSAYGPRPHPGPCSPIHCGRSTSSTTAPRASRRPRCCTLRVWSARVWRWQLWRLCLELVPAAAVRATRSPRGTRRPAVQHGAPGGRWFLCRSQPVSPPRLMALPLPSRSLLAPCPVSAVAQPYTYPAAQTAPPSVPPPPPHEGHRPWVNGSRSNPPASATRYESGRVKI